MSQRHARARNLRGSKGHSESAAKPQVLPVGGRRSLGGGLPYAKGVFSLPYLQGLRGEVAGWLADLRIKPVQAIFAILTGVSTLVSVLGIFSSDSGGSRSYSNSGSAVSWLFAPISALGNLFSRLLQTVPGQILVYLVVCGSLAWTLATLTRWLTNKPTEGRLMLAHGLTFLGGALIAVLASAVFSDNALREPGLALFVLAGIVVATYLVKTNFYLSMSANSETAEKRAALILNLALSAVGLFFASKLLV